MINLVDKKTKGDITNLINLEINLLKNNISIQHELNNQILIFFKSFVSSLSLESNNTNSFETIHTNIDTANFNLKKVKFNISTLENLLKNANELTSEDLNEQYLRKKICEYNKICKVNLNKVFINTTNIQNYIYKISFIDSDLIPSSCIEPTAKDIKDEKFNESAFTEKTLIISEMTGKVTLPYCIDDLESIQKSKEIISSKSFEEIIEENYTIPLKNYKHAALSRFKEAYKLIIEKEHGSKKSALTLALELFSNYNLHPAIITACKNLNELDVYLSCLEYNELEDFHFFKVNFEIAPVISKASIFKKNISEVIIDNSNEKENASTT